MMKKIEIGLIVAILCIIVALAGCTTNNNSNTSPSDANTSTSNASDSNSNNPNDVILEIDYPGNWGGSASGTFGYRGLSGQGKQTVNLGSVSGVLSVSTWKNDASSGTMSLTIKRDGKILGSQSNSYGSASITVTL
ncbi:MAG: hypothetical protein ACOX08_04725 [Methanobacterium sp.]|jgi:hypothetical protein|uniref:hypothetical protein n=1 Tax=Methanobacterium sp. MZD130B TaxID=3394378 RepID=UPI0039FDAC1F